MFKFCGYKCEFYNTWRFWFFLEQMCTLKYFRMNASSNERIIFVGFRKICVCTCEKRKSLDSLFTTGLVRAFEWTRRFSPWVSRELLQMPSKATKRLYECSPPQARGTVLYSTLLKIAKWEPKNIKNNNKKGKEMDKWNILLVWNDI